MISLSRKVEKLSSLLHFGWGKMAYRPFDPRTGILYYDYYRFKSNDKSLNSNNNISESVANPRGIGPRPPSDRDHQPSFIYTYLLKWMKEPPNNIPILEIYLYKYINKYNIYINIFGIIFLYWSYKLSNQLLE